MANQDDFDALYACPLSEFLDRRKGLAAALRKAGDKDLAAKVASAAKPTPAAWAVNQLARRYPGEMDALMQTGAALRAELRASFAGRPDASAKAMANAQAEQRTAVTALAPLARALLEAAGASASAAILERVATTLTAISTTGTWGDCAPLRLTKELDPPGIEALAALVADVDRAPARVPAPVHMPAAARAATNIPPASDPAPSEAATGHEDTTQKDAAKEDAARRAAARAAERLAAAEAALQAAAAAEERAKAACQSAQAAVAQRRERREERQAHAREAARLAAELEQAADEARKKAQAAAATAQKADVEVEDSVRAERAARGELAAAEQAVERAATERAAAEASVRRVRQSL